MNARESPAADPQRRGDLSRREFLRTVARGAALGLIAPAAWLAARKKAGPPAHRCINGGVCPGCGAFERCGLPAALSARHAAGSL